LTNEAKRKAPVNTGRLRASITPAVEVENQTIRGIVGSNVSYAPYMELGTGIFAGGSRYFPPPDALETWARRHGMPPGSGFIVARAIFRRGGLKPRRFLQGAFEENKDSITGYIERAVGDITTK